MPRSYFSIKNSVLYKTLSISIVDKTELNRTELKAEDKAKKHMKNIYNFFDNKLEKESLRGPC